MAVGAVNHIGPRERCALEALRDGAALRLVVVVVRTELAADEHARGAEPERAGADVAQDTRARPERRQRAAPRAPLGPSSVESAPLPHSHTPHSMGSAQSGLLAILFAPSSTSANTRTSQWMHCTGARAARHRGSLQYAQEAACVDPTGVKRTPA